jgi:hypothetical protein
MADGPLARLFWRAVDAVDYSLTQVRLGIVDAVCGPEPRNPADEKREADRERLRKAFPKIGIAIPD